jgi:hypothetical protein
MRKTLLLSALVAGVLGIVAVAYAANVYKVDFAKVTPTKSGTLKHPKAVRIQFGYSVSTTDGNRPATSTDQQISFGAGLKGNGKLKKGTKFAFAQCKLSQASSNACPSNTKVGSGIVKNLAGSKNDPSQKIPCQLNLTIYNGDGKIYPPSQNDGKSVREDVWLGLKGQPPICPLVVNAPIPAQFALIGGKLTLKFHISKTPFQEPTPGVENSVINVNASLFKAVRISGKTRGFLESTACPSGGRPIAATFTDSSGAKNTAKGKATCTK